MEDVKKTGGISVQTEHIFPIIKKWLYSEKEIFLREIVSNACDAVTKLKRLVSLGQVHGIENDYRIDVIYSKKDQTLTVKDNGIGMTEEELDKYLCNIALSGALDFIQKYEGEGEDGGKNGIIGHFGLGFYSAFMVSDTVDVITRSYTGAPAVKWVCGEDGSYELSPDSREERGTSVVMHINESESDFVTEEKVREILQKYCSFIPVEIYFSTDEKAGEEPVNEVSPLWQKNSSDCTKEEYDEFYKKQFSDFKEPLFSIHLNADYPLNFKGILYFPKINTEYESLEGQIKLYYNQVFVSDNIKEIIPDYLLMLKGVLDCPELPLNVSRSYLQNNSYVTKVSQHIVKKIADKLNSLFNTEREYFEKIWNDIRIFVEYGSLRDRKFYDRVKNSVLFPTAEGGHISLGEYKEKHKELCEGKVYYANDKNAQAQYTELFRSQGIEVLLLDKVLDTQFISLIEQDDESVKFYRVDSGLDDSLKAEGEAKLSDKLKDCFKSVSGDEKLEVKAEMLKDESLPAVVNVSEESRRFGDMMKMYGGGESSLPVERTLILNMSCPTVEKLNALCENGRDVSLEAKQIYRLALLLGGGLDPASTKEFIDDSMKIMDKALSGND